MIDVLVAGGGPVGLATALFADAAGLRVEVVEPRRGPVDKACGEGLMPGALADLRRLGVDPAGQPFRGIRYTDGRRRAEARFTRGPGRGVRRTDLHDALSAAVAARGIVVHEATVGDVRQDADGVDAAGLRARYLVGADGLHSPVRRAAGLDAGSRGRPRYGLRRHFALAPWTDLVEVHWAPEAEAYVTPVGPDEVGVAVLTSTRAPYDEHLRRFPALAERLVAATPTSDVRGAGPLRQQATSPVRGRVLLVGDAAGYVDALTGEGLAVGLASARALVDCLRVDRPADYAVAWRRASRRYRVLTHGLLAASRVRPVRAGIVPAAALLPPAFAMVVRQLAR